MSQILLTGASGFLGKYIYKYLVEQGNNLTTIGRSASSTIVANLSDANIPALPSQYFETVIHAAGKAHMVPKTEGERLDFFAVNVQGTNNLLAALEKLPHLPKSFVFISTVAVYGVDAGEDIAETTPLLGSTPYAKSKIEAEKLLENWCTQHNITLSILRLPLVAGANAPGNLGAMVHGIKQGKYVNINGGIAKKSIVMAEDVARIIPLAAQVGGIYNLTDGFNPNFYQLSNIIAKQLHKATPKNIPFWVAKLMAFVGDFLGSKAPINTDKLNKIVATLTFDDSKAKAMLSWKPNEVLQAYQI